MRTLLLVGFVLMATTAGMAAISEKMQKKLDAAEATFKAAVDKADNARFYAVQKASVDRVKVLKLAMTEATKSGDLDAANEIKARLELSEKSGGFRDRPKTTAKFGGHEYALINESITWHLAEKRCREMGGHLVCVNSPQEEKFVMELCGKTLAWMGANDEETEGTWVNVDGTPATFSNPRVDNDLDREHSMSYDGNGGFQDWLSGGRCGYVCEWEK